MCMSNTSYLNQLPRIYHTGDADPTFPYYALAIVHFFDESFCVCITHDFFPQPFVNTLMELILLPNRVQLCQRHCHAICGAYAGWCAAFCYGPYGLLMLFLLVLVCMRVMAALTTVIVDPTTPTTSLVSANASKSVTIRFAEHALPPQHHLFMLLLGSWRRACTYVSRSCANFNVFDTCGLTFTTAMIVSLAANRCFAIRDSQVQATISTCVYVPATVSTD